MDKRIEAALWAALAAVATKRAKETAHHLRKGDTIRCHLTTEGRVDDMYAAASFSGMLRIAQRSGRARFQLLPTHKAR